jgi:putative (di)nucleoside polyphosphate hydrolase
MLVFNSRGELFLGQRRGEPTTWQFPQGGVEAEHTLEENVLRELEEELGAARRFFTVVQRLKATHTYDFVVPRVYGSATYRGQTQTFFLVEFQGDDSLINLATPEPEFMGWGWYSPAAVRVKAEPKRLSGYLAPLAEFEAYRAAYR